jgi:hypothetical protein
MMTILNIVALTFLFLVPPPAIPIVGASTTFVSLKGNWVLDEKRSDSLAPLLEAYGAPAFIARSFAKKLNKDILNFYHSDEEVCLSFKRGKGSFPVKMQADVKFKLGQKVCIPTPSGDQEGHVVTSGNAGCNMIRYGPKEGEKTEDNLELHDDGHSLVYWMLHTCPKGNMTRVRRVFSRVYG